MQDQKIKSKNKESDSPSTENNSTSKDSPDNIEKVPDPKDDGDKTKDVVNEDLITISDDEDGD